MAGGERMTIEEEIHEEKVRELAQEYEGTESDE